MDQVSYWQNIKLLHYGQKMKKKKKERKFRPKMKKNEVP